MRQATLRARLALGVATTFGCVAMLLTDVAGVLLRPNYNPFSDSVSQLALGPTGWVQDTGMVLAGVGVIACAIGLYLALARRWEVVLGEIFLLLAGGALVVASAFKSGSPGIGGQIHASSSIAAAILFLPVCFLVSPAVREHKALFIYTIVAGIVQVGLEIGRGTMPEHWMFFGLHERLIGANALAWVATMGWARIKEYAAKRRAVDSRYAR